MLSVFVCVNSGKNFLKKLKNKKVGIFGQPCRFVIDDVEGGKVTQR